MNTNNKIFMSLRSKALVDYFFVKFVFILFLLFSHTSSLVFFFVKFVKVFLCQFNLFCTCFIPHVISQYSFIQSQFLLRIIRFFSQFTKVALGYVLAV